MARSKLSRALQKAADITVEPARFGQPVSFTVSPSEVAEGALFVRLTGWAVEGTVHTSPFEDGRVWDAFIDLRDPRPTPAGPTPVLFGGPARGRAQLIDAYGGRPVGEQTLKVLAETTFEVAGG
jgi:hypothetical protein